MKPYTETQLRDLDAWIGINVFGWHRQSFNNGYTRQNLLVRDKFRADKYRKHGWVDGYDACPARHPSYSTDPAAAFQVLEKCAEKLFSDANDTNLCISRSVDGWIVDQITTDQDYGTLIASVGETLPITICLFSQQLFGK